MASPELLLIVDDSEAERTLMAHTLGAAFPEAEICSSGHPAEVGQLCAERKFDCVLLDYHMPELDGLALARQLRTAVNSVGCCPARKPISLTAKNPRSQNGLGPGWANMPQRAPLRGRVSTSR